MEIFRPLRILMIHGYRQNEHVFRDKTGGLRKNLKNLCELVYCEAYHNIPKEYCLNQLNEEENLERCWFLKEPGCSFNYEEDFKKSIEHLDKIFRDKGPFDGIWGFSQGATMVAILTKLLTDEHKTHLISNVDFKFVIIAATSKSIQNELDKYYDSNRKIDLPSLHIIGKNDKLVEYTKALELTEYFKKPKIYIHELGHCIPSKKNDILIYSEFLNEMNDYCKKN